MNIIPCFSMPGGGEWIIIIFFGLLLITSPIAAVVYYSKTQSLKRENQLLKAERDNYLNKLLEKTS